MKIENINAAEILLSQLHDKQLLLERIKKGTSVSIGEYSFSYNKIQPITVIRFQDDNDNYNPNSLKNEDYIKAAKQFVETIIIYLEMEIAEIKSALETL